MRKRILCPVIASVLLMTGCQSGPPECSDPQTLEIFQDLQQQGSKLLALTAVVQAFPVIGIELMSIAPEWWAKAAAGMVDDAAAAYTELAEIIVTAEQFGGNDNKPSQALKATVDAAGWSSVSVSDVVTLGRTERRTACSATVSYALGFPSAKDLGLADGRHGEMLYRQLEVLRSMKLDVEFSTYYSDDGTHFVEIE